LKLNDLWRFGFGTIWDDLGLFRPYDGRVLVVRNEVLGAPAAQLPEAWNKSWLHCMIDQSSKYARESEILSSSLLSLKNSTPLIKLVQKRSDDRSHVFGKVIFNMKNRSAHVAPDDDLGGLQGSEIGTESLL
jgi:hypothetical protein